MKLLLRCDHLLQAQHLANVLNAAAIPCEVRNVALGGAIGDIPWLECAPQIWIRNDVDEVIARRLLDELDQAVNAAPWACGSCDEPIEPQFAACWRCGASRPS